MQADIFDRTVRAFRDRVPFRPFAVVLANGNGIVIDCSTAVTSRYGRGAYLDPKGRPFFFDHDEVAEIVDLDDQPADPAA